MKIQNLTFAILMSSAIMTTTVTAQDIACGSTDEELKLCWDIQSDDQNVCVFRKVTGIPYEPSAKEQKSKKITKDTNGKKYKGSSKQKKAFKEWMGYWQGYSGNLSIDDTLTLEGEKYACYPIDVAEGSVGMSGTPDDYQMSADYSIIPFTYVPPPPEAEPAAAGGDGGAAGGDGAATTNTANAESDDGKVEELWAKVQELEIYFQVLIIVGIVLVLLGFVMMCCCCKTKEIKDENKIMAKPIPTDSQKPSNKMDADIEKGSQEMELTSNMGD